MQNVFFGAKKNRMTGVVATGVTPLPSSPHWAPTKIVFAIVLY
jgi:hypothetical protein